MLRWFMRRQIAGFEREFGYDAGYLRELVDADPAAAILFSRVSKLARYRKDAPRDAWYAAKITAAIAADCGPCTQLVVTMAEREGVPARLLAALVASEPAALPEDARLGRAFACAAIARAPEAEVLRAEVARRWGPRAVVALAFAVTAAPMFPALKAALGHASACQRVTIGGAPVAVTRAAVVAAA